LIIPQLFFTGFNGEQYSPLNHFVSELGWIGFSELANLFNICLFIGGILFIPFIFYLNTQISHNLWRIGSMFGFLSAIGCCLVGIFPMNSEVLFEHALFAAIFFIGSATMMVMLSISMVRAKKSNFPKFFALSGLIIAFLNILLVVIDSTEPIFNMIEFNVEDYLGISIRPDFWLIAFIEWLIVLSILVCLNGIAIFCIWKNKLKKGK
jgi:hypothetical membrane protein